jgi:hypothetical protein
MHTVDQIKRDVMQLSATKQEMLLDWLTNLVEDRLEMTNEFKAEIECGKLDIAAKQGRVCRPGETN